MLGRGRFAGGAVEDGPDVPPPPRTPSEAARRIVFAYAGGQQAMISIGVVFSLVGTLLTLVMGFTIPAELALDLSGVPSTAVVTSAEIDRSTRINGHHPIDLGFRYELDGRRYEASSSTTDPRVEQLRPGATVEILYLRSHPDVARVQGGRYGPIGYFGLFPLIFAFIGLPMALLAWRSNRREIRAFTHGEATLGRLLSFEMDRTVRINKRHPWRLVWEFEVEGRRFTGTLSSMEREVLEPYAVQAPVVLFDRADPSANTLFIP